MVSSKIPSRQASTPLLLNLNFGMAIAMLKWLENSLV